MNASNNSGSLFKRTYRHVLRLEKRIAPVAKLIGYVGIFIVTPAFFILGLLGISFTWPEQTLAQKEALAQLRLVHRDTTKSGALQALRGSDGLIDLYVAAGVLPDDKDAFEYIRGQVDAGAVPGNSKKYFPILQTRRADFGAYLERIRQQLADFAAVLRDASGGHIDGNNFCERLTALAGDLEAIRVILPAGNGCFDLLTQTAFLRSIMRTVERLDGLEDLGWQKVKLDDPARLLNLATLNERSSSPRPRQPIRVGVVDDGHSDITVFRASIRISRFITRSKYGFYGVEDGATSVIREIDPRFQRGGRVNVDCDERFCTTDALIVKVYSQYYLAMGYDSILGSRLTGAKAESKQTGTNDLGNRKAPSGARVDVEDVKYSPSGDTESCSALPAPRRSDCMSLSLTGSELDVLHAFFQRLSLHYSSSLNCAVVNSSSPKLRHDICRALKGVMSLEKFDYELYGVEFRRIDLTLHTLRGASSNDVTGLLALGHSLKGYLATGSRYSSYAHESFRLAHQLAAAEGRKDEELIIRYGAGLMHLAKGDCDAARRNFGRYRLSLSESEFKPLLVVVNTAEYDTRCSTKSGSLNGR